MTNTNKLANVNIRQYVHTSQKLECHIESKDSEGPACAHTSHFEPCDGAAAARTTVLLAILVIVYVSNVDVCACIHIHSYNIISNDMNM